jgi:Domain of unknown function (DUF4936)
VRELFVWYRVRDERAEQALAAVRAMHGALVATWPGLQARLLKRTDPGDVQTWMETYAQSADSPPGHAGIDADIARSIEVAALPLAALIDGARHTEAFTTA